MIFKVHLLCAIALLCALAVQVLQTDPVLPLPTTDPILPLPTTDPYAVYQNPAFKQYLTDYANAMPNASTTSVNDPVDCGSYSLLNGLTRFYLLESE